MRMKLRQDAEERLKNGTAPVTREWPTGVPALKMLYDLSSSRETASEALKFLHELQVHQVELDLQYEQAEHDCRQLTDDLTNYTALFELAQFAYLTLNAEGLVIAANCIAADWLAAETGQWKVAGHRIEDLLAPECRAAVRGMLDALREGAARQFCAVQSRTGGASANAVATAMPGGAQVLMAFLPTGH